MKGAPTHPLADAVAVYTDGGLLTKNPSDVGGVWAWVAVSATDRNLGFKSGVVLCPHPTKKLSNNHMEQIAIVRAIEALPDGWDGVIYTDSDVARIRVESDYEQVVLGSKRFPAAEKNLYTSISERSKRAVAKLGRQVRFVLLQGHPTKADLECGWGAKRNLPVSKWNVWADRRCVYEKKLYMEKQTLIDLPEVPSWEKPCPFVFTGTDFRADATGVPA